MEYQVYIISTGVRLVGSTQRPKVAATTAPAAAAAAATIAAAAAAAAIITIGGIQRSKARLAIHATHSCFHPPGPVGLG